MSIVNEDVKQSSKRFLVCRILTSPWVFRRDYSSNGLTAYFRLTSIELWKRISVSPFEMPFVGDNH